MTRNRGDDALSSAKPFSCECLVFMKVTRCPENRQSSGRERERVKKKNVMPMQAIIIHNFPPTTADSNEDSVRERTCIIIIRSERVIFSTLLTHAVPKRSRALRCSMMTIYFDPFNEIWRVFFLVFRLFFAFGSDATRGLFISENPFFLHPPMAHGRFRFDCTW